MNKFRVIPQSDLGEKEFEYFPVWSEHYDWEEIEDIVRWGFNKEDVLKMFKENEKGNEHSVYTLLESNPFPERMRIFIRASLTTSNGTGLQGYVMNENAFCLGVFVNGDTYYFSRHEMLGELNLEAALMLAGKLDCEVKDIFPISYKTDFNDKSGSLIEGEFKYGGFET